MAINVVKMKEKIKEEIINLGFDMSLKGTHYLIECIYIVYVEDKIDCINLKEDIYPLLSKKYKKKTNNIKCDINYSITSMYNRCSVKRINKYFSFFDNNKPTTKLIIYTILNKIML